MCVCLSEHGRTHSVMKSAEVDGQRLQGLIDGNKRWLEMRKKDTSMYPSLLHTHYYWDVYTVIIHSCIFLT